MVGLAYSYVEWVTAQPGLGAVVFKSRFAVSSGPFKDELIARKQRNRQLKEWMGRGRAQRSTSVIARRTYPSLIDGAAEKLLACVAVGEGQKAFSTELLANRVKSMSLG